MSFQRLLPCVQTEMIDLNNSILDTEKSDVSKHKYVFKKKVMFDKTNLPPYVLKWARKTDNLKSAGLLVKLQRYGYFAIEPEVHGILPDPFCQENIDENGHVVYIDGLLCGIEYEKYIEKRGRETRKGAQQVKAKKAEFLKMVDDAGGQIDSQMMEFIDG